MKKKQGLKPFSNKRVIKKKKRYRKHFMTRKTKKKSIGKFEVHISGILIYYYFMHACRT